MIASAYEGRPRVSRAMMFGSEGLRNDGKFFAFVGAGGGLIVKLEAEEAARRVSDGAASPVRIGRNAAREWVELPPPKAADLQPWRDAIDHAYRYATQA